MNIWEQLNHLVEGPEDKAAAAGAGGAGPTTPSAAKPGDTNLCSCHKKPMGECPNVLRVARGNAKKNAARGMGNAWEGSMEGYSTDDMIKSTEDKRNKKSLTFDQWQKKIENWTTHISQKNPVGLGRFREAEKETAYYAGAVKDDEGDVATGRNNYYKSGATYDQYIGLIARKCGLEDSWTGLRRTIGKEIRGSKYDKKGAGQVLPGDKPESTDPVDVERATPEFKSWEEKVALPFWKSMNKKSPEDDPEPDQQAWDETMHFFASEGDQGKNWKYLGDKKVFARLLARYYGTAINSKENRRADYEKQKAAVNVPGQQAMTIYNPQAIQMDKEPEQQRQIDPNMFKKKYGPRPDAEKRKFATWWDPFGFQGDIPFTKQ